MATFFERHKRKSVLGLLILFVNWKKGLGPLLLLVVMTMFVFVTPSNLTGIVFSGVKKLPGGTRLAAGATWVGAKLGGGRADKRSFSEILADYRAAERQARAAAGGILSGATGVSGRTSLGMVSGSMADLASSASVASKVKGGSSVKGVLTPEDAEKGESGVPIHQEELGGERAGAVQSAVAGGFPGGPAGMQAALEEAAKERGMSASQLLAAAGAYAGKDFFSGGMSPAMWDSLRSALGNTKVPNARSGAIPGMSGKLSKKNMDDLKTKRGQSRSKDARRSGNKAFQQLADGRARAMMARDPLCTASGGCPPEYATTEAGALYDGNRIGVGAPEIILAQGEAPGIDNIDTAEAVIPSDTDLTPMQEEADRMTADAAACKAAREKHIGTKNNPGPVTIAQKRISNISRSMRNMNCASVDPAMGGGCNAGNQGLARSCDGMGNEQKAACYDLDKAMENHYLDCPLMQKDGPYRHQDC